jgi:arylsulfatase A-like enzyme
MKKKILSLILFLTASLNASERLNVILMEMDDLNYKNLAYMGHPVVKTPHLDKLAAQETVFNNCIVQGTTCAPSRNSLLTGRYPHK